MPRTTIVTAAAALLAISMPAAFAQTNTTRTMPPPSGAPAATASQPMIPKADKASPLAENQTVPSRVMPGQVAFSQMNGATVYGPKNDSVGDINDVVLDRDGKVAAVVVKTGAFLGIGGKKVALAMHDVKFDKDQNGKLHLTVDMTKDQLKSAQSYETSPPNTATGSSAPPAGSTRK